LDPNKISYDELCRVIKAKDNKRLVSTLEFFPEEGKYHFDGHAKCGLVVNPFEKKYPDNRCPICRKPLTIGVANRVSQLADRKIGKYLAHFPASTHLVPLQEIIASSYNVGKLSKKVIAKYMEMTAKTSELKILLDLNKNDLKPIATPKIIEGIIKMRRGQVKISPGYDGIYGKVRVFDEEIKPQKTLF
jgi:PHP family Zn ribbon phosphoesterase